MKKLLAILLSAIMVVAACACLTACGKTNGGDYDLTDVAGTYDITVWVSETKDANGVGVTDLTMEQIKRFNDTNEYGIVFNATIEGVTEAESATQMITDVESGADLFCFAQDQTMRLMDVGALTKLGANSTRTIKERNDEGSIKAAQVGNNLYCYPLTSDNGYFMYYDKTVISEDIVDSLEDILAACEAAGRNFSYEAETSGWYNAGMFFATGCESTWTTNDEGEFTAVNDTFNSEAGVVALKGMQKILKSSAYKSSSDGADFAAAIPSAVVITGTWAKNTVVNALGDNMGVADLPSFTVDGKSYHMGSFSGNKLMGIKPQQNVKKAAALQQLALYLTNDECQLERFNQFGWGPSNKVAQANEAVASDPCLVALAQQSAYAVPQGQIHGKWWDMSKTYAVAAKSATLNSDVELKKILEDYAAALASAFEVVAGWTVVGGFAYGSYGNSWMQDYTMTKTGSVWKSDSTMMLTAGDEFKVREGRAWDTSYGVGTANYVVETTGRYYILFDEKTTVVTLEAAADETWTVIGNINGDDWSIDLQMTNDNGVWTTNEAYEMTTATEFKVRMNGEWDVCYGNNGGNYKPAADGTYYVQFDECSKTITLKAAE